MPLILAVEPDRRQASHIAEVLRGRPRTELVMAESAAAALKAIGARIPDVLLTSPLLSRQDEARVAEWLRGLGPDAARVQALTIPILATAAPAATTRGMLSALRRRRPRTSSPAGCEPAVFADQVGLYLARASVERQAEAEPEPAPQPPPAPALRPEPQTTLSPELPPEPQTTLSPALPPEPRLTLSPEPPPTLPPEPEEPSPELAPELALVLSPAAIEPDSPEPTAATSDTALSNRVEAVIAVSSLPVDEDAWWIAVPLDDISEAPPALPDLVAIEPATDSVWVLTPVCEIEDLAEPLAALPDAPLVEPAADDMWMLTPVTDLQEMAAQPPELFPEHTMTFVLLTPIYDLPPEPVEAIVVTPPVDVEPTEAIVVAPPVDVEAAPPDVVAPPTVTTRRRKPGKPKKQPVQDEWGFFDPSQCGFAALLDKLDEITAEESAAGQSDHVTVRVISY